MPGVDQPQAEIREVTDVAGRQGRPPRQRDAGDLGISNLDAPSCTLLPSGDRSGCVSSSRVEGKHPAIKTLASSRSKTDSSRRRRREAANRSIPVRISNTVTAVVQTDSAG